MFHSRPTTRFREAANSAPWNSGRPHVSICPFPPVVSADPDFRCASLTDADAGAVSNRRMRNEAD